MNSTPVEMTRGLIELTTARLRLRAITLADADALTEVCSDIELARGTLSIPHPYSRERCEKFIREQANRMETNAGFVWGIAVAGGPRSRRLARLPTAACPFWATARSGIWALY